MDESDESLKLTDIKIAIGKINYGFKDKDPVNHVKFFIKGNY